MQQAGTEVIVGKCGKSVIEIIGGTLANESFLLPRTLRSTGRVNVNSKLANLSLLIVYDT